MADIDAETIHTALADRLGTALRSVIRYDAAELDYAMRQDVAAHYTEDEVRQFVDSSIVHQIDSQDVERPLRLGTQEAVVRTYERSWVVQVTDGHKRGCLFSVERDEDVSVVAVEDGIDIVREVLDA